MAKGIVYYTDSSEFGGAEQALLHLLAGLDRQDWNPILFYHAAPKLEPLLEGARKLDISLRELPAMPLTWRGVSQIPRFVRSLRAIRPAVFHAHLTWSLSCKFGLAAAIVARIPAIVATQQLFPVIVYRWFTRLQQRFIIGRIGKYIAVSQDVGRQLHQTFNVPEGKIRVVHNGILLEPFTCPTRNPAILSAALNCRSSGQPLVLTNARLNPQKGLDYLLEAVALVPEAIFIIAGEGPERPKLEKQVKNSNLGGRVIFLGFRRDIPDLLAGCDLFVLPSLFEGLPLSILEAMAAGKPVIATKIGGTDEAVIQEETGLLVPPGDAAALAGAIRRLLAEPELARQFGQSGKKRVYKEFSAQAMVRKTVQIYNELLAPHKGTV